MHWQLRDRSHLRCVEVKTLAPTTPSRPTVAVSMALPSLITTSKEIMPESGKYTSSTSLPASYNTVP